MPAVKFFSVFFFAIFFISSQADARILKVARLPIIIQSRQPSREVMNMLEKKIERAIHIPLNGTLKLTEEINSDESSAKLNSIWQNLRRENKKAKISDAVKPLAKKIDADIIVCPILKSYSENFFQSGFGMRTHLSSYVSAELIVYDGRTDELIDEKTSRNFHGDSSKFGKADYLVAECFDRLISKTKLHQKFMEIK